MPSSTEGCKPQGRTVICVTLSRNFNCLTLLLSCLKPGVYTRAFVTLTNSHYLFRYTTKFLPQFLHHVIQQGIGEMHVKLKLNQSLLKETRKKSTHWQDHSAHGKDQANLSTTKNSFLRSRMMPFYFSFLFLLPVV